jgi:hypothetical protein
MKKSESDLQLLNIVNSVILKTSELLKVIRATTEFREGGNNRRVAIASIRSFRGSSDKATAVILRLQALAKMAEKNELEHWVLASQTPFSPMIAHRALISATARHPLSLVNGDFVFEKEAFLRSVLELAKPEGRVQ